MGEGKRPEGPQYNHTTGGARDRSTIYVYVLAVFTSIHEYEATMKLTRCVATTMRPMKTVFVRLRRVQNVELMKVADTDISTPVQALD